MRVPGRFGFAFVAPLLLALVVAQHRLASVLAQRLGDPAVVRFAQAVSRHLRLVSVVPVSRFVLQSHAQKTAPSSSQWSNPAVEGTPNKQPLFASCRLARRPSLLR